MMCNLSQHFFFHLNKLILTLIDFEVGFKMTPKQQWYVWLARGMTTTSAVMIPFYMVL